MNIVLLGAPGSGKGTQAVQLSRQLKLVHIATGDLFRDNLQRETPLGQQAKGYMERGALVPDDVTDAMVKDRLAQPDTQAGFILDGYPRTLSQAEALSRMLSETGRKLTGVLYINVRDGEIVSRLSGRLICRNCQAPFHLQFKRPAKEGICDRCGGPLYQRADDNAETVGARLQTFHAQTKPLIDYYSKLGILVEIAGEGAVAKITEAALNAARRLAGTPAAK